MIVAPIEIAIGVVALTYYAARDSCEKNATPGALTPCDSRD